jgi:hypothetical protein
MLSTEHKSQKHHIQDIKGQDRLSTEHISQQQHIQNIKGQDSSPQNIFHNTSIHTTAPHRTNSISNTSNEGHKKTGRLSTK